MAKKQYKNIFQTAFWIALVGALNWGLVSIGFNLVEFISFGVPYVEQTVYAVVGISALVVGFGKLTNMMK